MGALGPLFALFTVGYIVGVWTACAILRQPQRAYEDAVTATVSSLPVIILRDASYPGVLDAPGLNSRRP